MPGAEPAITPNDATEICALLRLLANEKRLMILANLMASKELSVDELASRVGLSKSALSQHLARLRAGHVAEQRRQSQTIYYRIADRMQGRLYLILQQVFGDNFELGKIG